MWFFKKNKIEDQIKITGLFQRFESKAREITIRLGLDILAISAFVGGIIGYGATAYAVAGGIIAALNIFAAMAVTAALNFALQALTGKKPSSQSIQNNGRIINTREVAHPLTVIYGECKVGGNWIFCDSSGSSKNNFNTVVTWGEGEVQGLALEIDSVPDCIGYIGTDPGLNDMQTAGIYTGTSNRYCVTIDTIGTPDTFRWSDDFNVSYEATTVAITGDWQDLNNGVKIRFKNTTGHGLYVSWFFNAGDGIWLGEKLMMYYESYTGNYSATFSPLCLAYHTLHTGTSTQTNDADMTTEHGVWNDPLHYTAYSHFKLIYNDYAWNNIPEYRITLKGLKVHDTRDVAFPADTPTYSRNPALCWYDLMTNSRYGLGIDASRIDTTSVSDAANWCDTNTYYLDMVLCDPMPFTDHIDIKQDSGYM